MTILISAIDYVIRLRRKCHAIGIKIGSPRLLIEVRRSSTRAIEIQHRLAKALSIGGSFGGTRGSARNSGTNLPKRLLLDVRQNVKQPAAGLLLIESQIRIAGPKPSPTTRRKMALRVVMILK